MDLRKFHTKKFIAIISVPILIFVILGFYWWYLWIAHSSFENYYKFRGCVQLIEKTDTYGTCKILSGENIKIVKFQNRWYLDGDLPYSGLNFL